MMKHSRGRRAALLVATMPLAALLSPMAQAQTAPTAEGQDAGANTDGDIVITGSRILRRDVESAAPLAIVGKEEITLTGTVNVEQVINQLPQVVPGATAFSNNPGGGVSTLDLRGLGATRTMILVNGRRYVFYDANQLVDANTIPAFLIQDIEVVTGGAGAVYGSDALSGVVNFKLRNDLNGVLAGSQYSITERGDGRRYNAYIALGTTLGADERGHATVYGEYYNREPIFQGARTFSAVDLSENSFTDPTRFVVGGSSTTPNGRFTSTYSADNCPTGNVYCSPGAYYTAPGVSRRRTATDVFNFAPDNYLMVPQERYLMGGYADYDFSKGHTAYIEATFINNRVANQLAATPVTGTFNVNIASVAPFVSAADATALRQLDAVVTTGNTVNDGIVPLTIQRRVIESGGRNSLDERNAYRFLAGVRGPVIEGFTYDAYYSYARTRNSNIQAGNISRSAFQAGLNGTATPINIFGPGTLTPAMVDQISILAQNSDISVLQVLTGSVSGNLFDLGLGGEAIGIALGGEYRKVSGEFVPDTALSSGDVIGFNAGNPTSGSYSVKEVFGEINVPIIAERPFFYALNLNGAFRYSDYSLNDVGGVWTYSGSAEWSPIRDIKFRGQYQRAVRAPNVQELFGGQAANFPQATDPCALTSAAGNAAVRNLCIATGVPAAAVGTAGLQLNSQIQSLQGGNPALRQEKSDSITAGVVLRPRFLPGLTVTVDYFDITIEDTISTLGGGLANSLDLCYNVLQDINSVYCQAFVGKRNALGQFDGVNAPQILNANVGKLMTKGLDLQVDYSQRLGVSLMGDDVARLNFAFLGTYTDKYIVTPVAALPDITNDCAGGFGQLVCGNPLPRYKWTSRLSYVDGPATLSFQWRHLGAVRDDDDSTNYLVERINAYNLFSLAASFVVDKKLTFSLGVNNLFDKQPTTLGANKQQAGTYPSVYDVLGRDYFFSAQFSF